MKPIRYLAFLLAAMILASLCGPLAFATDGLPSASDLTQSDRYTQLSDSMYYDEEGRMFAYPLNETGQYIYSNMANGMISANSVFIKGGVIILYKDGDLFMEESNEISDLSETGEYVVMTRVGSQTLRLFSFTLTGPTSSVIYGYNLPASMFVTNATLNGEEIAYDRYYVPMQEDGDYHIEYECMNISAVYSLDVTVDRQPPELQFSGSIDEKHRVHSALKISGIEEGGTIRVTLDGSEIEVPVEQDGTAELLDSGNYVIEAYDAAGNRSEYVYTIMIYLNSGGLIFLAILIASILAVVIYIFFKRRKLKIG